MPIFDPSTHDDRIDISITLAARSSGAASFTALLLLVDATTPGGGTFASYSNAQEVAADVTAGNLTATAQAMADVAFGQGFTPDTLLIGAVDTTGGQTYVQALDAVIAAGANFYGVAIDDRTPAVQVAVSEDIEGKADSGTFLVFGMQSADADWLTSSLPSAFNALAGFERTIVYYHDDNGADAVSDRLDVAHVADRLAADPDVRAAGWNSPVSDVDALTTGLTAAQKSAARANRANTALPMGTITDTYVDPGYNLNGRPFGHIVSVDWLRARMQEAVADLIVQRAARGERITADAQGQALIAGEFGRVLADGVDIGHFSDFTLTALPVTAADITAARVRFDCTVILTTGVRAVTINVYATDQAA